MYKHIETFSLIFLNLAFVKWSLWLYSFINWHLQIELAMLLFRNHQQGAKCYCGQIDPSTHAHRLNRTHLRSLSVLA